jgi:hypothetical protein
MLRLLYPRKHVRGEHTLTSFQSVRSGPQWIWKFPLTLLFQLSSNKDVSCKNTVPDNIFRTLLPHITYRGKERSDGRKLAI